MEKYLNILHYCFYIIDYKMHLLANKINPFRLLRRIPLVKRRAEQQGIDLEEVNNNLFGDKRFGVSISVAGGALGGTLLTLMFSFNTVLYALLKMPNFPYSNFFVFIFVCISYLILYLFVTRNDKYLKYFKKYEKWTKRERYRYCLITLAYVVFTIFMFFGSFYFHSYMLGN